MSNLHCFLGISLGIAGNYPGGPPDSVSLLGLHTVQYHHIDIPIRGNTLNPEILLESQSQTLYPVQQEGQTAATGQHHEIGHLMAYFTNQDEISNLTLIYVPLYESYVAIIRGIFFIMMTPIHAFNSSGSRKPF